MPMACPAGPAKCLLAHQPDCTPASLPLRTSSGLKGLAGGLTLGCLPKLARASSGLRAASAARSMRGTNLMVARCTAKMAAQADAEGW